MKTYVFTGDRQPDYRLLVTDKEAVSRLVPAQRLEAFGKVGFQNEFELKPDDKRIGLNVEKACQALEETGYYFQKLNIDVSVSVEKGDDSDTE